MSHAIVSSLFLPVRSICFSAFVSLQLRRRLSQYMEQDVFHVSSLPPMLVCEFSADDPSRPVPYLSPSGGRLEVKLRLPARADVYGLWPAVWTSECLLADTV